MLMYNKKLPAARGFSTPPPTWNSKRGPSPPLVMPASEKKPKADHLLFHVIHKVPAGDSPYVRAKHIQLIEKDPGRAISLFWAAINSGDRVDSALKDMAVVMKQLNRSDEAIEAIKSFRHLCPPESQQSLDNVLVELYKRSGRVEEQIEMLQLKLKHIEEGIAFGGKRTKAARSQGKKIQITIEQEYSRLLGNLAWAYMQQNSFKSAEELYRKALSLEPDKNKQCNLAICLMYMNKMTEAKFLLHTIKASSNDEQMDESFAKSFERAIQILDELESKSAIEPISREEESSKGIRTPSISLAHRNQKEVSSSASGNVNYLGSGNGVSRSSSIGRGEETGLLDDERNGGSDKGNLRNALFGPRNVSHSSPGTSYVSRLKKGCYMENTYKMRTDIGSNQKDNWPSTGPIGVGSSCKKTYASPFPPRGVVKVPFTQPRRSAWSFNNRDCRRASEGIENASCNRKLSFENGQPMVSQNLDIQIQASTNEKTRAPLHNSNSWAPSASQDWRKPIVSGDWKMNSGGHESNLSVESSAAVDYARAEQACPVGDQDRNQVQHKELSMCRSKKSWADLVEEDELELLYSYPSQESSYFHQTPHNLSEGLKGEEEFNNENLDSNIIHQTPAPLDPIENLTRKIESLNSKDGYYTQPQIDDSTVNRTVKRSLCFDQQDEKPENFCSSPFPKKALNFESYGSLMGNEKEGTSGNGVKLMRRNRLQVFRDITLLPESPRP